MKNTRRCKVCRARFLPMNPNQSVCVNSECITKFFQMNREKMLEKQHKSTIKEMKDRSLTVLKLMTKTQPVINKISSLIDGEMNCICCGAKITPQNPPNAGHRFSVKSNNTIRFNLHNIHRNGVCCNKHAHGNPDGYNKGLVDIYGLEYFHYVVLELKGIYKDLKLTRPEMEEFHKKALSVKSRLMKNPPNLTSDERLKMRDEINKELGLYEFGFIDWTER